MARASRRSFPANPKPASNADRAPPAFHTSNPLDLSPSSPPSIAGLPPPPLCPPFDFARARRLHDPVFPVAPLPLARSACRLYPYARRGLSLLPHPLWREAAISLLQARATERPSDRRPIVSRLLDARARRRPNRPRDASSRSPLPHMSRPCPNRSPCVPITQPHVSLAFPPARSPCRSIQRPYVLSPRASTRAMWSAQGPAEYSPKGADRTPEQHFVRSSARTRPQRAQRDDVAADELAAQDVVVRCVRSSSPCAASAQVHASRRAVDLTSRGRRRCCSLSLLLQRLFQY